LKIFLIISFVLKTLDIIHLVIRQTGIEIFFIDWERSKTGIGKILNIKIIILLSFFLAKYNGVSVWRTYFVANEYHEIQTFRRINVSFQLFFVLFLLKVNFVF